MTDIFKTISTRPSFSPVTNYHCGLAAVLALAFRVTNDPIYLEKANLWYRSALARLDRDGLNPRGFSSEQFLMHKAHLVQTHEIAEKEQGKAVCVFP